MVDIWDTSPGQPLIGSRRIATVVGLTATPPPASTPALSATQDADSV